MAIRQLVAPSAAERAGLAALLRNCIEQGASVGFMLPLAESEVERYWAGVFAEVGAGEKILLVCDDGDSIAGSVQLSLCGKANGRHRAEIQKLLVHTGFRQRGHARALMRSAEQCARERNLTLLVLDTEVGSVAEMLYARVGYTRLGTIPHFAMSPHDPPGAPARGSTFFYREL